jgi:Pectate lyase superfamily protein
MTVYNLENAVDFSGQDVFCNNLYVGCTQPSQISSQNTPGFSPNLTNVKSFGAKGDGKTNDASALQAALSAMSAGTTLYIPAGNYLTSSPLSVAKSQITIKGDGPYTSIITYTGSSTTTDILTIGQSGAAFAGVYLADMRITSNTLMTNGAGIHWISCNRSQLQNIVADGQDGTGKLFHGFWFDGVDMVRMRGYEARAISDGIRVNGNTSLGQADLIISEGKIASCSTGLRIGGGFGGFVISSSDIITNGVNVSIDNTISANSNRELFFSDTVLIDSAKTTSSTSGSFVVNDSLTSGASLTINSWLFSCSTHCLYIQNWPGSYVSMNANMVGNSASNAINIVDSTIRLNIGLGTLIRNNTGYGISAASNMTVRCHQSSFTANTAGATSATVTLTSI